MKNRIELLAPAGSYEKMIYALEYGADAVYAGLPDFSLRARINKFDENKIIEAIDYVHRKKRKIYITVNVFAHNSHIKKIEAFLKLLKTHRPDAIIASDPGVIEMIGKQLPGMDVHLSTQANTTNWRSVKFWKAQGVKRIILARELNLGEIAEIHRNVPGIELEYFVHGAMCMAYSGRCLLSSWMTGRSSNLGDCSQNCRWRYDLVEEKSPNEYIPVEQDMHGSYLLNSKDICLIDHLDELGKAGISSFKIEGRAKSAYYLAQVVKSYREAMDIKEKGKKKIAKIRAIKHNLSKLQNRSYSTGFLFDECEKKGFETRYSHTSEEHVFVGEVMEIKNEKLKMKKENPEDNRNQLNNNLVKIKVHNALYKGDKVEIISPKGKNMTSRIKKIIEIDSMQESDSAHGGQNKMVYVSLGVKPEKYSIIRKYKHS
ncbi:MAG: U32 family peptidase C-terminal domain-containing protein [Candidatus Paceibacterota bacterium]|jgi:putative protease